MEGRRRDRVNLTNTVWKDDFSCPQWPKTNPKEEIKSVIPLQHLTYEAKMLQTEDNNMLQSFCGCFKIICNDATAEA